ncbi:hypothetical protein CPC_A0111 [Clostridium perfringens C str. JGS1495]|uniref:Uncharacterized protein n=1 Tax=Clostridium perfringens D str. JGS1721 TaxID=488537 RepID=B1V891_CLOPF|nr:hypothetical protein CPC_A0111 [Clostridium perfringens C str. JGS1495]EDT69970.1 hypothetical protein CJD_A0670 [Clostridium perfringens D str. JGS1721]
MNAGGVLNTCKSSDEVSFGKRISGGRVSNTWVTCLIEWNSLPKGRLIPHNVERWHHHSTKGAIRYEMDPRRIS